MIKTILSLTLQLIILSSLPIIIVIIRYLINLTKRNNTKFDELILFYIKYVHIKQANY